MKRYTEMTREELRDLTKNEVNDLIDLELAYQGVKLVLEPMMPQTTEVTLVKTVTGYEVKGVYFVNHEDALKVAGMKIFEMNYDYYGAGYDYKWLELSDGNATVTPVTFYSKKDVMSVKDNLKSNKILKDKFDEEKKEYDKFYKETSEIRDAVRKCIDDAFEWEATKERCIFQYEKYLRLADNNIEMARRFFEASFVVEEDIKKVVYEVCEEKLIKDKDEKENE